MLRARRIALGGRRGIQPSGDGAHIGPTWPLPDLPIPVVFEVAKDMLGAVGRVEFVSGPFLATSPESPWTTPRLA